LTFEGRDERVFGQLRVEVVIPGDNKSSTTTHMRGDGLQNHFADDVNGQTSCMVFHAEKLVIDRVFLENLRKCSHVINDRRHHSHEMSDRKSRIEGRSPYLPLRAVASQHIATSSYD
jgi:hypothetical protein